MNGNKGGKKEDGRMWEERGKGEDRNRKEGRGRIKYEVRKRK